MFAVFALRLSDGDQLAVEGEDFSNGSSEMLLSGFDTREAAWEWANQLPWNGDYLA